jgi:hypothetical protein
MRDYQRFKQWRIWGLVHAYGRILVCCAVQHFGCMPTFRSNILLSSSGLKCRPASIHLTVLHHCLIKYRSTLNLRPIQTDKIFKRKPITYSKSNDFLITGQCCATFLHSRHTKNCRRVMAAHQPHSAYCGGGGGGGILVCGIVVAEKII